jgi:thiol-disulfide isomerase/thioredoxin
MLAGISLVVWSGVHNIRQRRLAAERLRQARVDLVPDSSAAASDSPEAPSPLLGKPAPAFTLADLAGRKVSLGDFKGHPLVINYWGTYCPPCKLEMPWLEDLSKKYAPQGLDVVGITFDSEVGKDIISKDVQKLGVTYPILLSDPAAEKAYLSDSEVLPMSFYVDKSGKIIKVAAGASSKDDLEAMVKETVAAGTAQ